jgi:hypothetical protein
MMIYFFSVDDDSAAVLKVSEVLDQVVVCADA